MSVFETPYLYLEAFFSVRVSYKSSLLFYSFFAVYKEDGYTGVPTQVVHQSNGLVSTYAIKEKAVKEMEMVIS